MVVVVVVIVEVEVVVLVVVPAPSFDDKAPTSVSQPNRPTKHCLNQIDHATIRDVGIVIAGVVVVVLVAVVVVEVEVVVLVVVLLLLNVFTLKHLLLSTSPTDQPSINV